MYRSMLHSACSTHRALRLAIVLAAVLILPTAAMAVSTRPSASTHDPSPSGLVVVLDARTLADPSWHRAVENPSISGVAVQINWRDIEPNEGKPDWSTLDEIFAAAQSSKKWVHLLIFPGFFSPAWALQGVRTELFPIQYGPGKGTLESLPMPWNTVYLNRWFAFLRLVSDRYGKSPALRLIAADGPTSVSAEFTLPESPQDLKKWQDVGYTPRRYIAAWHDVFQTYAADFPDQYISLSEGGGVNINDNGRIDRQEHLRTRQALVDQAMDLLGNRFALQSSDVHAGPGPHSTDSEAEDEFVIGYCGRVITGFQMRGATEGSSGIMGAEGNPPLALRRSIDLALKQNDAGKHIDYLEIYAPDVLADEMQSALRYGASLLGPDHDQSH